MHCPKCKSDRKFCEVPNTDLIRCQWCFATMTEADRAKAAINPIVLGRHDGEFIEHRPLSKRYTVTYQMTGFVTYEVYASDEADALELGSIAYNEKSTCSQIGFTADLLSAKVEYDT